MDWRNNGNDQIIKSLSFTGSFMPYHRCSTPLTPVNVHFNIGMNALSDRTGFANAF